jgi:hypothetical protein
MKYLFTPGTTFELIWHKQFTSILKPGDEVLSFSNGAP